MKLMKKRDEIIRTLKALKPILKDEYHIVSLSLFGSYAKEEATPQSDLDILIETDADAKDIFLLKQNLKVFLSKKLGIKKIDITRSKYLKLYAKPLILQESIDVF